MAQQTINIGTTANDGTGDPLRTAFDKCNDNFDELYASSNVQSGDGTDAGVQDTETAEIVFGTAFSDTSYSLFIACYTATGQRVNFKRTSKTATGFKIIPDANCTIEWIAK